ncbi:Lipoprotein signal peptidase [Paraconexibacter sp. AEG42_29]|uniref:Lipoprotein signal peptidase n=2 Tax=Paraconexibacter sp. AEG42_29 TaxID=2997339 RepID=A0AAU7AVA9_9ACTN
MWLRTAVVLAIVLVVDQVTKALVRGGVDRGSEDSVLPGVTLVHTKNRGVAFSALEGRTGIISVVIAVAVIALLVYVARNALTPGIWVPAGLLTGGAFGNIIDRAAFGEVTDFIKLPAWPAFNVADMAITFGVVALLYVLEKDPTPDAARGTSSPGVSDAVDSRS